MTGWRDMQQGRDGQPERFVAPRAGSYGTPAEAFPEAPEGSATAIPFDTVPLHDPVVFTVTPSCHMMGCGCGTSGPFRATHAEAHQDADQHRAHAAAEQP